jgi:hypothetical protein
MTALERLNAAQDSISRSRDAWNDMVSAWDDPRRFLREKLVHSLSEQILGGLRDARGDLTDQGPSSMQLTHNFLFSQSLGNSSLHSRNAIIAAIQGTAAEEIRRAHLATLSQLETALRDMKALSTATDPGAPSGIRDAGRRQPVPTRSTTATPEECAVLDSPRAADLAIDHPPRFEALLDRCGITSRR